MGNIILKEDSWFINGYDKIEVGDEVESFENGNWKRIEVSKDANGIYHESPSGEPFNSDMTMRRPVIPARS